MSFAIVVLVEFSEWGWFLGFILGSVALAGLAVLADALYEGYRERHRQSRESMARLTTPQGVSPGAGAEEKSEQQRKQAA